MKVNRMDWEILFLFNLVIVKTLLILKGGIII